MRQLIDLWRHMRIFPFDSYAITVRCSSAHLTRLLITEMSEQFARYLIEGKAAVRLIKVSINKQFDLESEINK